MKFLIFYIISTVICFLVYLIVVKAIKNRFCRENPQIVLFLKEYGVIKKTSFSKRLSTLLPLLLPIVNIILTLIYMLGYEEVYKKVSEDLKNEIKTLTQHHPSPKSQCLEDKCFDPNAIGGYILEKKLEKILEELKEIRGDE